MAAPSHDQQIRATAVVVWCALIAKGCRTMTRAAVPGATPPLSKGEGPEPRPSGSARLAARGL